MKPLRFWPWLLLLLPVGLGLMRLRFDAEVLDLLPARMPVVQGLKLYQQNFANARELIITVSASEAGLAESSARTIAGALRARPELVAEATWIPPWLEHPEQAAEFIAYLWLNQPPPLFAQLTNRLAGPALTNTLAEAREALATSLSPDDLARRGYDPLDLMRLPEAATASVPSFGSGSEHFASGDGTFRIVFAEAAVDLSRYRDCATWLDQIKDLIETARSPDGFPVSVTVNYTGRPAFVAEIGGGMERDMVGPSAGTLAVIALLFYFAHRCWRPLLWLLVLLVIILAGTLALGGLVYGTLNVVSLGFASILLGLAEDFGIVLYQESRTHPHLSLREIRREAAPGIFWSAVTTAGAFLLLNLSGLPGLGQLGTLVAIGVALAAVVMLFAYLPPLLRSRNQVADSHTVARQDHPDEVIPHAAGSGNSSLAPWIFSCSLALAGLLLMWQKPPRFDNSPDALRPVNSRAYAALDELKSRLNRPREPLWVVMPGRDETEVRRRLDAIEAELRLAVSNRTVSGYTLPTLLVPNADHQNANRPAALALANRLETLREAVFAAGFTRPSLAITENILRTWQEAAQRPDIFWPTNANSRWILEKMTARTTNQFLAIGLIYPQPGGPVRSFDELSALSTRLLREGVWLSGWELLGPSILKLVKKDLRFMLLPILALVTVSLWLAFRNLSDVLLSLATLAFSGLCLHLLMSITGWSWNMMNLVALPLLLGMGVDFSIHIQLALRRHRGDLHLVRRSVGRALLLAGSTTVAGFASLAFASNAGLASLGKVCAAGILCAMITAIFLLPVWWKRAGGKSIT